MAEMTKSSQIFWHMPLFVFREADIILQIQSARTLFFSVDVRRSNGAVLVDLDDVPVVENTRYRLPAQRDPAYCSAQPSTSAGITPRWSLDARRPTVST